MEKDKNQKLGKTVNLEYDEIRIKEEKKGNRISQGIMENMKSEKDDDNGEFEIFRNFQ